MAPVAVEPETFEDIEDLYCGSVYPGPQFFEGCETALCLFSAEWLGKQDVYWLAKMGLDIFCVDINGDNLVRMQEIYPQPGFQFVAMDVYEFATEMVKQGRQWDVVTLDPWTSQFGQCADLLPTWTMLARKTVVLGHGNYRATRPQAEGWTLTHDVMRSDFRGGVWWLVYQRD